MTPEGVKREKDIDRSQSITQQTGRKLDYVIIAVLISAVAFLLVDKFVLRHEPAANAVTDKSVAVLPFVAMSNGPDDEYFADGLTEEILNALAQLPDLLVSARTSAFYFKGQDIPVGEIAAKLGVAHIVEGSVRRDGEQLRVTAQLVRASDGFHLWSDTYDRSATSSFAVQSDIAEKVAASLNVVLDEEQRESMREIGLRDPEAAIVVARNGLNTGNHVRLKEALAIALIAAGQFEDAKRYVDSEFRSDRRLFRFQGLLAAARNDAEELQRVLEAYASEIDDTELDAIAITGDREWANEMAHRIDAQPYGYLRLMTAVMTCYCGAPFDLESTPDFARRLEEANLPWPPSSPIDWPLKNW